MAEAQKPDSAVIGKRKNVLKDDPETGLKVTASLRDQQLEKLATKLEDMNFGAKVVEDWNRASADRSEWLERQEEVLKIIDEFIDPIYEGATDWASTLHLPTVLTVCKTMHARFFAALWGVDPPFICRARTAANEDRAMLVEELMRYTLRDWANEYDGVEETLDAWLWDWVTKGNGILKARWAKKFTRFEDVESIQVEDSELVLDEATGNSVVQPVMKEVEREVVRTEQVYAGPMLERKFVEDIIIIGGEGDPQKADKVLEQGWMTASELWSLVDQKIFRKDAVELAIRGGRDYKAGSDQTEAIKMRQVTQSGRADLDTPTEIDRYRVIEAYYRVDVDGSGIASDVIVWVHARSRAILRATYLRRVMPSGKRPYFNIHFHKRHGTEYSVGLPEMLYTLDKEIDAQHNINIDIGIMTSMPFGFYRPTASSMREDALPIEPGAMIPVDNPQSDIAFPNLGGRTGFGFQEQAALVNQIERLTSISELNLGIIGAQGATRTATGTRAILGESSNNLNIFIQRMNRGWKRAIRYIFEMLQERIEPGFQFRITGDDGNSYWKKIESKQELCGMYDFELDANSANSNKQVQIEQANMVYQMTANPIDLQLGIVTPANRYEALVNMLKVNGIKSVAKYATKPQNAMFNPSPIEILDRILAGIDVPFNPTMDLEGFISLAQQFIENDELNGQFGPAEMSVVVAKAQEAMQLAQAIQQAQAQAAVGQQQHMNTQAAMTPQGAPQQAGPMAVMQQPAEGQGG
jgi:hypothetical protein